MFGNFTKRVTNKLCVVNIIKSQRCYYKNPDFTSNNYNVQRGNFNTFDDKHVNFFRDLLGDKRIIMDLSDLEKYNVDWMKQLRGNSRIVLKPKTTKEVSEILKFCNDNRLPVCPQGGNTGIVGGGVPVLDEIIISTDLMDDVISLDEISGVLVCQAGCILENLDNRLAEKDLMMPLDLGAKGSCHIGGNVSTNAGGLRLLRYGNMHGNVLGLEVVKSNGEILDLLSTLKKDNTGFHLKHLFIGSEGTLGFITKIAIQCSIKPKFRNLAFLGNYNKLFFFRLVKSISGLQNYKNVLKTFAQAKANLSEILSAVEVMDTETLKVVKKYLNLDSPIGDYPYYLMIETSGSNEIHDQEKLDNFLKLALNKHFVLNGTVISEPSKFKKVWSIRERVAETFVQDGHVFCYDFTLPLEHFYKLVAEIQNYMGSKSHRVYGFGHLGDGNLHLQIAINSFNKEIKNYIEPYIYKRVNALNGSISSEHGIGFLKAKYLHMVKDNNTLELMKNVKKLMDPNGILNPYKMLSN